MVFQFLGDPVAQGETVLQHGLQAEAFVGCRGGAKRLYGTGQFTLYERLTVEEHLETGLVGKSLVRHRLHVRRHGGRG